MEYAKFFISPVIGGIIGYFTNWLAIKMLFRPHKEIKVFNLKLPFTPGLIPKEKERIARSVGTTTAKYLLSEEVIVRALSSEELLESIAHVAADTYHDICYKNNYSLNDFLTFILEDDKEKNIELISDKLTSWVIDYLSQEENLDNFASFIASFIEDKLDVCIGDIKLEDYIKIDFLIEESVKHQLIHQILHLKNQLCKDNFSSSRIIPDIFIEMAMDFAKSQLSEWMPLALGILEQPSVENKIKEILQEFIRNNLGKLTLIFVDVDKLYNKIKSYLKSCIEDETNQKAIFEQIDMFIKQLLEKPVCQWIEKIEFLKNEKEFEKTYDKIIFYLSQGEKTETLKEKLKEYINNQKEKNILSIVKSVKPDIDQAIENRIKSYLKHLIAREEWKEFIRNLIKKESDRLLSTPVNQWFEGLESVVEDKIKHFTLKAYKAFVLKHSSDFIKQLDISDIVENRIIEFDTDEMEEIILSVVDRELKAITWLGGLLGLVIGFVPLLLS
ncbi:MAG TPA: DUF445 family protein [Defluviitaleaceae bacterium]|nr:DUF445 family protein [Defluviitaleaceae bacterium]